jgi:FKBP-type peptidyl-prolyl cis-trans isomerase 2
LDEGLLDMCVGEKRRLLIPSQLGFGEKEVEGIPRVIILIFYFLLCLANSDLEYEIELVKLKKEKRTELTPLERAEEKKRKERVKVKSNIINFGKLQNDGSRLVNAIV